MKSIKQLIAGIAIAVTAFSANAAVITATPNPITSTGAFYHSSIMGLFDDYVQFNVGAPNGGSTWAALSTNFTGLSGLTSLGSALYAGTWNETTLGSLTPISAGSGGSFPTFPGFSITYTNGSSGSLMPGAYTLRLQGMTESGGGSYGGTITLAPVPEPGEWALMLSGFGLIALMVRRRTANAS